MNPESFMSNFRGSFQNGSFFPSNTDDFVPKSSFVLRVVHTDDFL